MAIDDNYTKALLHFDGADASTTIVDESGKSWVAGDNVQIDTAQSVFGGASLLLDGSGDYVATADSDDFNIGAGDFTIDFRLKKAVTDVLYRLCGQSDVSATAGTRVISIYSNANNSLSCLLFSASGQVGAGFASPLDTNWHHIAVVRYGNTLTIYCDGVAGATVGDVTGLTAYNSSSQFAIGREGESPNDPLNGWIDEFRFSKGIARWTSNFTPPTSPYMPCPPTSLLAPMWFI